MGLFGSDVKKDLFIDLDRGIIGTFIGFEESMSTDPGQVFIKYVPLGAYTESSAIVYTNPVRREHVYPVINKTVARGAEPKIVFVWEGGEDSLVHFLESGDKKRIKELTREVESLNVQVGAAKQRADDAFTGIGKTLKQIDQVKRKSDNELDNAFESKGW